MDAEMNGAEAAIRTLVKGGVTTCFANPGTSEMQFVSALDAVPAMRGVLCLFEGVATGAADGFGRMADGPASTLLHLGPGLGNGLANLHNARRAATPVVNIVGDHATTHLHHDAPLTSDIESVARTVSVEFIRPSAPEHIGKAVADAITKANGPPGGVATLLLPADVSWGGGAFEGDVSPIRPQPSAVSDEAVDAAARLLKSGERSGILLGGRALRRDALVAASRIAAATGASLLAETFAPRTERGAGIPAINRLKYLSTAARNQLAGLQHLILVEASSPVAFFAYPETEGDLVPDSCATFELARLGDDSGATLEALADLVGSRDPAIASAPIPERPAGALTAEALAAAIASTMPDGAVVCDEANSAAQWMYAATAGCAPHDWLQLTGGAIGVGLPLAVGAAIACPDRPVVSLEADGSAMYTIQALWTQARESLDVTTVIMNNRSYAVLGRELSRTGARAGGERAGEMFDLTRPDLDFVDMAHGMGVPARSAGSAEEAIRALEWSFGEPGPHLIDARLTSD